MIKKSTVKKIKGGNILFYYGYTNFWLWVNFLSCPCQFMIFTAKIVNFLSNLYKKKRVLTHSNKTSELMAMYQLSVEHGLGFRPSFRTETEWLLFQRRVTESRRDGFSTSSTTFGSKGSGRFSLLTTRTKFNVSLSSRPSKTRPTI